MLRANQAVRLGLRAASRNPELPFLKALIDQGGSLLAILPVAFAALLTVSAVRGPALSAALLALETALRLRWAILGGVLAALVLLFFASALFWAGALPVVAADAELNRRPPPGNFLLLLSRGAARTVLAASIGWAIVVLFAAACALALAVAAPVLWETPSILLLAAAALIAALFVAGAVLLDVLARLTVIRAAVFGDSASAAFGKAASLLGGRLGGCVAITLAFMLLEILVASATAALTGMLSGAALFRPRIELTALPARAAIGLAAAAIFSWLEVGRMGALAAIAADAEGMLEEEQPAPVAELVVDALPAED